MGHPVVAVDHKPLLGLLNDKSLADIENPRLLMLKEKTLWFNFDVIWIAGSKHCGPDYMSRRPKEARLDCIMGFAKATYNPEAVTINDLHIVDSIVGSLSSCLSTDDVRAITFEEIKSEVARDQEMLDLIKAIEN